MPKFVKKYTSPPLPPRWRRMVRAALRKTAVGTRDRHPPSLPPPSLPRGGSAPCLGVESSSVIRELFFLSRGVHLSWFVRSFLSCVRFVHRVVGDGDELVLKLSDTGDALHDLKEGRGEVVEEEGSAGRKQEPKKKKEGEKQDERRDDRRYPRCPRVS